MSDDDEKKPRSNRVFYWLGAFILICLLAMVGQYLYWKYKAATTEKADMAAIRPHDNRLLPAIQDYDQWVNTLPGKKLDADHEIIRTGLRKIAAVLTAFPDSVADGSAPQVKQQIGEINTLADSITYNHQSVRHADMIKNAFSNVINVFTALNNGNYPDISAALATLKQKVGSLNKQELTLEQQNAIKATFMQVNTLLNTIKVHYAGK